MSNQVDHPSHYQSEDPTYETINVIEAWGLDFCLGNVIKYISRAGKKGSTVEDLEKAAWYLSRKIIQLKSNDTNQRGYSYYPRKDRRAKEINEQPRANDYPSRAEGIPDDGC